MNYFLLVFIFFTVSGLSFAKPNHFNDSYMSKHNTTSINGIFVFLVFMTHMSQYLSVSGPHNDIYLSMRGFMGQTVVSTFLIYSGYGIMKSIQSKDHLYVKTLPSKALQLLIQFDIALLFFVLCNLFIKEKFDILKTIYAMTTLGDVGNSNWYFTAIIILHLIVWLSFIIFKNNNVLAIVLCLILTIAIVYFFIKLEKPTWTYNSMICLPIGLAFAHFQDKIDSIIKNDLIYFIAILLSFSLMFFAKVNIKYGVEMYSLFIVMFGLIIILLSKKIVIENNLLFWLGSHVFSIYILQRIPMRIAQYHGLTYSHPYISVVLCFISTIILALFFDKYVMPYIIKFMNSIKKINIINNKTY